MIEDALTLHRRLGTGRQVHHPRPLAQRDDAANIRILRAREDVDAEPHAPELSRELPDVDVHAARFLAPERRERTSVHTEHGDT
jgi:hypothetical protein